MEDLHMESVPTVFRIICRDAFKLRVALPRVLAILCLLINAASAFSQDKVIWEIGRNDKSAREFQQPTRPQVSYDVRTTDWKKDWPATQACGAPYEIVFSIETPSGGYALHVSVLTHTPVVPTLQINVNGHSGDFYLRP